MGKPNDPPGVGEDVVLTPRGEAPVDDSLEALGRAVRSSKYLHYWIATDPRASEHFERLKMRLKQLAKKR